MLIRGIVEAKEQLPEKFNLVIGIMDGVHRGHQKLLESAKANKMPVIALTFWPHPSITLKAPEPTPMILNLEEKVALLHEMGTTNVIVEEFSMAFAAVAPVEFVKLLLQQLPGIQGIFIGEDFRFGHKREGDAGLLKELGKEYGFEVESIARLKDEVDVISSTRIRNYLKSGKISKANDLLGYYYSSFGSISNKNNNTYNVKWTRELEPRHGVYAAEVIQDNQKYPAVMNFGIRPTLEEDREVPIIDIHTMTDTSFNIGDFICIEWLSFMRQEKQFDSKNALKEQIQEDIKSARNFFSL